MNITPALKKWLTDNCDVKADATDDEYKKAAADALVNGKLAADVYAKLIADPDEAEANEFSQKMDTLTDAITKLAEAQTKQPEKKEEKKTETETEPEKKTETEKKDSPPSDMSKMIARAGCAGGTDGKGIDVRVKEAAEQYSTETKGMVYGERTAKGSPHFMAGMPVMNADGNRINELSDRNAAVNGAYWKYLISSARIGSRRSGFQSMNDHDRELMLYAMDNMKWAGVTDGGDYENIQNRQLTGHEKQALIDDAVSGGTQAVPIVFDDDIISTPLLFGQLFPKVKLVTLGRVGLQGVEGVLTLTPTSAWGGVDNTPIGLFNTAVYVQAFNTNVYRWESAIQIGLDFLSDTTINFGQHITKQYGEVLLRDLDNVIATGNGTTQPNGIMNSIGTTINFGGGLTLGNLERVRFSVALPEHESGMQGSAAFCGTEQTFERIKALTVGGTDVRRLFGLGKGDLSGYDKYSIMDRQFAINESLANSQMFYAIMGRYRMYKRRGLTLRTSTEGSTLMRRNLMLMVVTARYGGQLERGAAAAGTTTATP